MKITATLVFRPISVCMALICCSCVTTPDVNQHKWQIEVSPVADKHATFALLVQRSHNEHRGNSKGQASIVTIASAGQGRKVNSFEHGINYGRFLTEVGLKVYWTDDYYVKAEYDAKFLVTGVDKKVFEERSVRGSTKFYVKEGKNMNTQIKE